MRVVVPVQQALLHVDVVLILVHVAEVRLCPCQDDGCGGTEASHIRVPVLLDVPQGVGTHNTEAEDDHVRPATGKHSQHIIKTK